jgi:DNA primase
MSLHLSEELEEFRTALYNLLFNSGQVDVELIYTEIGYKFPRYYEVLQDIHGDRTDKLRRGHRLFMRFPILANGPPPDFVERCIDHFVHDLEIEQMISDLTRLKSQTISDTNFEETTIRMSGLVRDIHKNIEQFNVTGSALAEEASEIKVLGRRVDKPMPVTLPVLIPAL